MLLNLLRGTGLKRADWHSEKAGLYPASALSVTRAELAAYAAEHRIPFVEDSTNGTDDAARNIAPSGAPGFEEAESQSCGEHEPHGIVLTADEAALDACVSKTAGPMRRDPKRFRNDPPRHAQDAPEALRDGWCWRCWRRWQAMKKDLTAAHIRAVLTLDPGPAFHAPGVTVLRGAGGAALSRRRLRRRCRPLPWERSSHSVSGRLVWQSRPVRVFSFPSRRPPT